MKKGYGRMIYTAWHFQYNRLVSYNVNIHRRRLAPVL